MCSYILVISGILYTLKTMSLTDFYSYSQEVHYIPLKLKHTLELANDTMIIYNSK